jgi:hypothetical protein
VLNHGLGSRPNNIFPQNNINDSELHFTLSNIYCDQQFLLDEENNHTTQSTQSTNCPEIEITINKIKLSALIDTGSNITCMSNQWYDEHKPQLGKHEILPVNNTFIKTATNGKSRRASHIIMVPVNIQQQETLIQILLVPNLIRPLILGMDTIRQWKMAMDFDNEIINMNINNNDIVLKFGQVNVDGILCHIFSDDRLRQYENMHNDEILNDYDSNEMNNNENSTINEETINEKLQSSILNEEQKKQLTELLLKYQSTFSDQPGLCTKYQHVLQVENPQHFKCQTYPVPLIHQNGVMDEINKMERMGIIERSNSTFINPIIPVIKKSGEIRLCLDARKSNEIITPDYECNQSVNEILAKCQRSKYISSIDLTSSYWQVPLSPESRQYTAFQFRGKVYQYKVTPFGISTSQAALVRALDKVFDEKADDFTMVYIDDICIISPDFESHLQHLEYIFTKLNEANMTIKFSKSEFCKSSIPFLGYTLTTNGLEMDKSKLAPILNFPTPKNKTQLKSFLGCINYYNKFLAKFSKTVQPLLHLTSKKNKFIWTSKEDEAFAGIKRLFLETNVLHHPDVTKPFYLQTDASDFAVGGHLYQLLDNGDKAAVMFLSRTLQPAEQRFTTTEKELLAIVYCLQKTRYIILGTDLKIITDNHALTFLRTCKLLNNRLTRWILAIQEYNFEILHCKGADNPTADALSRAPSQHTPTGDQHQELTIHHIERIVSPHLRDDLRDLPTLQSTDPNLQRIYEIMSDPDNNPEHTELSHTYKIHNQILYKKLKDQWLIIVPEQIINKLIWECHLYYLHCGAKKCFQLLRECFTFKNMNRRIRVQLATCDSCQRCKINPRPPVGLAQGINCTSKNDQISVDVIGPLPTSVGNVKYILIVIDNFTKFVKLYPMRRANAETILRKLFENHFPNFGLPNKIQSDNGTQFKSNKWIKKLEGNNITPIYSPVYYPQYNIAERPIKEVKRCLRTYCAQRHRNWSRCIPEINNFLNEVYHETTGYTPNELQFGKRDERFWEKIIHNPFQTDIPLERKLCIASQRIREKRQKRAAKQNRGKTPSQFKINDLVLIRSHPLSKAIEGETAKLFEVYEGPFKICDIIGHSTYLVSDLNDQEKYGPYHVTALKKYLVPCNSP